MFMHIHIEDKLGNLLETDLLAWLQDHPEINQESDFIEYSTDPTDPSKKFYYTCPRFWCMLTDKMVTEKDILDGKCGPKVKNVEDAIIPKRATITLLFSTGAYLVLACPGSYSWSEMF